MDATERFSNRVQDYACYRPHYPADVIGSLQTNCHPHLLRTRNPTPNSTTATATA